MTTRKPHESPPPPPFDLVTLRRGPLHGRKFSIRRANPARLYLRLDDPRTQAIYVGDSAGGELQFDRTVTVPAKRRFGGGKR